MPVDHDESRSRDVEDLRHVRPGLVIVIFLLAAGSSFGSAAAIVPVHGKLAFCFFGLLCIVGIIFRWGPLVPSTILAFFLGYMLPYKHGYAHTAMESVEHDLIDPTICAALVPILVLTIRWLPDFLAIKNPVDRSGTTTRTDRMPTDADSDVQTTDTETYG